MERDERLRGICAIYVDEGLVPPTSEEKCSAIVNGWGYLQSACAFATNATIVSLKIQQNIVTASQLSNLLCHRLHIIRDNIIQQNLLTEDREPT